MKLSLLFWGFLLLAACGFQPVYKDGPSVQHEAYHSVRSALSSITVDIIPNREGQAVRNYLIDTLYTQGTPLNPQYRLKISPIKEHIVEIGIDRDDEASRAQLRQETNMTLFDASNKAILSRTIRATTGYNILAGQFTTFVTEEDARRQAQKILADNITTQLELYFNQ